MTISKNVPSVSESPGNTNRTLCHKNPCKRWVFTYNNYNCAEVSEFYDSLKNLKYVDKFIFGKEVGENGTPHLQGYIRFNNRVRWSSFKLDKSIHWEPAKGTDEQNYKYCSKDNETYEYGDWPRKPRCISKDSLYDWQTDIINIIESIPDERTIHWYYDEIGNIGKTSLQRYIVINYTGVIVVNGCANDIKCAIAQMKPNYPKIILYNATRNMSVNYKALEEVKDALFFSGKYESSMHIYDHPHVIVFSNEEPDTYKLSQDRWHIKNLRE